MAKEKARDRLVADGLCGLKPECMPSGYGKTSSTADASAEIGGIPDHPSAGSSRRALDAAN